METEREDRERQRKKTRQDKTRQDKTRQDKTRQDKTRQDKTRQDKTRQDKTRQDERGDTREEKRREKREDESQIGHGVLISIHNPMDTETLANELARQGATLQEVQQAVRRFEQLTIQAEERAKVAESQHCSHSQRHGQGPRAEEDHAQQLRCREVLARNVHSRPCGQEELRGVLGRGRDVPECSGTRPIGETFAGMGCRFSRPADRLSDVEAYEAAHGNPFDWNLKEVSEALGPLLHKVCKGSAGVKLKAVLKFDGFNAWWVLALWFQARSTNDSMSLLTPIMNPDRAKDLSDMMNKLDRWDALIRDYEMKFEKDDISDRMRQAALFAMAPEARTCWLEEEICCMTGDTIRDLREARRAIKLSGGGSHPPPDFD